jgi:hypothetical protein
LALGLYTEFLILVLARDRASGREGLIKLPWLLKRKLRRTIYTG